MLLQAIKNYGALISGFQNNPVGNQAMIEAYATLKPELLLKLEVSKF